MFDFSAYPTTPTKTSSGVSGTTKSGFNFDEMGYVEPEKKEPGFIAQYVLPGPAALVDYVKNSFLVKSGVAQQQEETLSNLRNLQSQWVNRGLSEKDPNKLSVIKKELNKVENELLRVYDEKQTLSSAADKTTLEKIWMAVETGMDLSVVGDMVSLLARGSFAVAKKVAPRLVEPVVDAFVKPVAKLEGESLLGRGARAINEATTVKPMTEAERFAFKTGTASEKIFSIAKDTGKILPESLLFGYGYDVSANFREGKEGAEAFTPGPATLLGGLIPVGVGALRVAAIPMSSVFRTMQSFGKSTPEMVATEQKYLKEAYDDVFAQRESTDLKNAFFKSQGKQPSEVLARYGLVPDTEFVNGKTILRTKGEGMAGDLTTEYIEKKATIIQKTLDNIQVADPTAFSDIGRMEAEAITEATKKFSGLELKQQIASIRRAFAGLKQKYGTTVGVGSMNTERIAANRKTKAWDTPQFERDAYSVLGDIFRKRIDEMVGNPIVRQINAEIGDLIAAREMLWKLHGKNVGGGRFTSIIASAAGAMLGQLAARDAGIFKQAIYAVASMIGIRAFLRVLSSNKFGGATTRRILSQLAEDTTLVQKLIAQEPEIINARTLQEARRRAAAIEAQAIRDIKQQLKQLNSQPLLEAGKPGAPKVQIDVPIRGVPPGSSIEVLGREPIAGSYTPPRSSVAATAKQMTNNTKNSIIGDSIAPKKGGIKTKLGEKSALGASDSPLLSEARKYKGKTFEYIRNIDKTGKPKTGFGQEIEPAGRYINLAPAENVKGLSNYETGKITFRNPLVVEWKTTQVGGWKSDLSSAYEGKTGKKLSEAIVKDGYDAIITVDKGSPLEVVDLTSIWEKANAGSKVDPLIAEARKYKTAEEFVKDFNKNPSTRSQGRPKGVDAGIDNFVNSLDNRPTTRTFDKGGGYDRGNTDVLRYVPVKEAENVRVYFPDGKIPEEITVYRGGKKRLGDTLRDGEYLTTSKSVAQSYSVGGGKIKEFKVKTKDLLLDPKETANPNYGEAAMAVVYNPDHSLAVVNNYLKRNNTTLTSIWNEAQKGVSTAEDFVSAKAKIGERAGSELPPKVQPTPKQPTTPDSPLLAEARKYKTPEEFVDAVTKDRGGIGRNIDYAPAKRLVETEMNDTPLTNFGFKPNEMVTIYRGVDNASQKTINAGDYITTSRDLAASYTNGNVISMKVPASSVRFASGDGLTIKDFKKPFNELHLEAIYNPNSLVKQSQLTSIWNEAQKGGKNKR